MIISFKKLEEFDQLWVPSKWQKECTVKQGYDESKIRVVPEGVDIQTFKPENKNQLLFGTIDTFLIWRLTKGKIHTR